jgi:putative ABC transport system permease protein
VHAVGDGAATTAFALGVDPRVQGDYRLVEGADALDADALVANRVFLDAVGAGPGDTLTIAVGYDPQLRTFRERRTLRLAGVVAFTYLGVDQPGIALPIGTLREMLGGGFTDRVSLFMVDVAGGADEEAVRASLERRLPTVTVLSTRAAMAQVDERLTYFRQLAFILGSVSLVVGFLLVTTLMTVSVNERLGEIAVLRAIGVSRAHVVEQIVIEGLAISLAGAALGLLLGLVTARWLNGILSAFPGLPASVDFFLFQPRAAWMSLGLLVVSAVAAGIFPAWRGSSRPIATTLRQEAVA